MKLYVFGKNRLKKKNTKRKKYHSLTKKITKLFVTFMTFIQKKIIEGTVNDHWSYITGICTEKNQLSILIRGGEIRVTP